MEYSLVMLEVFCVCLSVFVLISFSLHWLYLFSPDQRLVVVALNDNTVKVFFADSLKVTELITF